MRLGATGKEGVVGNEQEDYYAARRAAFEQLFEELPPPGTHEYWQRIETPQETPLPPEVLCRCFRERLSAGAKEDALRIFDVLFPYAQSTFHYWAGRFVGHSPAGRRSPLTEDLESECYLALWKELASGKHTFLLENFRHTLKRIAQHTACSFLGLEGLWKLPGVERPTRIPQDKTISFEASSSKDGEATLADTLPDLQSQMPSEERELLIDLQMLLEQLDPTSRLLIFWYYYCDYTQQQIGDWLGIGDRAVRFRLKKIEDYLRKHLGGEEVQHG